MRRARGALIVSASISFLAPAELAGGLALKESRYKAINAFDSPLGEKSPHLVPPPFPMDGKGSAIARVSISIHQDIACDQAPELSPGPLHVRTHPAAYSPMMPCPRVGFRRKSHAPLP